MIRYKKPDKNKALSLSESAKSDLDFTLTLPLTEKSANTVIRNIYESFRMLGEALLTNKGIQSEDHVIPIRELINLDINTKRPLMFLDHLRKMRRNINYYGYMASKKEAGDVLDFARLNFDLIYRRVLDIIKRG
ncbi:hypothetical protein GF386_01995 [Candidatus Pacearchaeota archaeon]|nr:hypothetical protein [Candidatus Pacearchaeota archaeon]MBD3282945.1 hypothetical protein [Candidatus Pacearchaeota archaeon]